MNFNGEKFSHAFENRLAYIKWYTLKCIFRLCKHMYALALHRQT